jgi:polyhydroxyalkanoate synthase
MIDRNSPKPGSAGVPPRTAGGLDGPLNAAVARWTLGISPVSLNLAFADWLQQLALSPDKQQHLYVQGMRNWQTLFQLSASAALGTAAPGPLESEAPDKRFADPAWRSWPFNLFSQSFLLTETWWKAATTGVPGVAQHHEDVVSFVTRQMLDAVAPANFVATNPVVLDRTLREGGANLARGMRNAAEDADRTAAGAPPVGAEAFVAGRDVAITPGKVIYRNRLIEVIQYTPSTAAVYSQPVLIMSAWIMKYYILDLSPQNSLIRYLVENGHTVFAISWKNPTADDRDLSFDDYRRLGFMAALDAVNAIVPGQPVHAVGYCLGGTLLAIAAAAMARDGDDRLGSMTLLAAQTDTTEAGEIMLFIDDAQVKFLEDMMAERGYLEGTQMLAAFQLLRSNDLIWSAMVQEYLLGTRAPMFDLMAWNADSTRMPARMHSEYLRTLFLNNDLAHGRFIVDGRPISLHDIRVPIFAVSTTTDHVAPWRSVYKIHELTAAQVTFVLSNGGHNVGVVNPPGTPHRHYRLAVHDPAATLLDAQRWETEAPLHEGSWWPAWLDWLAGRSGTSGSTPALGAPAAGYAPLGDAPGNYVFER